MTIIRDELDMTWNEIYYDKKEIGFGRIQIYFVGTISI